MKKLFGLGLLVLAILSCSKKNDIDNDPFYLKATIDGVKVEWIAPFVNYSENSDAQFATAMSTPGGGRNYPFCPLDQDRPGQYLMGTTVFDQDRDDTAIDTNTFSVDYVKSAIDFDAADLLLRKEFTNGPKTFGLLRLNCTDEPMDGILITYSDINGITWRARPGDPSNIAEQVSLTDETRTQEYKKKWKVRFSCKLYNEAGNYIELKEGEIYGPVWPI